MSGNGRDHLAQPTRPDPGVSERESRWGKVLRDQEGERLYRAHRGNGAAWALLLVPVFVGLYALAFWWFT